MVTLCITNQAHASRPHVHVSAKRDAGTHHLIEVVDIVALPSDDILQRTASLALAEQLRRTVDARPGGARRLMVPFDLESERIAFDSVRIVR